MATATHNNPEMGLAIVQKSDTVGTIITTYNSDIEIVASRLANYLGRIQSVEQFIDSETDFITLYGTNKNVYTLKKALSEIDSRISSANTDIIKVNNLITDVKDYIDKEGFGKLLTQYMEYKDSLLGYKNQLKSDVYEELEEKFVKEFTQAFERLDDKMTFLKSYVVMVEQMRTDILVMRGQVEIQKSDSLTAIASAMSSTITEIKEASEEAIDNVEDLVSETATIYNWIKDTAKPEIDKINDEIGDYKIAYHTNNMVAQAAAISSNIAKMYLQEGTEQYLNEKQDLVLLAESKQDQLSAFTSTKIDEMIEIKKDTESLKNSTEDTSNRIKSDVVVVKSHSAQILAELAWQQQVTENFIDGKSDFDNTREFVQNQLDSDRDFMKLAKIQSAQMLEDAKIMTMVSFQNRILWEVNKTLTDITRKTLNEEFVAFVDSQKAELKEFETTQAQEQKEFIQDAKIENKYAKLLANITQAETKITRLYAIDSRLISMVYAN